MLPFTLALKFTLRLGYFLWKQTISPRTFTKSPNLVTRNAMTDVDKVKDVQSLDTRENTFNWENSLFYVKQNRTLLTRPKWQDGYHCATIRASPHTSVRWSAQWTLMTMVSSLTSRRGSPSKLTVRDCYVTAAIATWLCPSLPSCGTRFESQVHHLSYLQFVLLKLEWEKEIK